MLRKWSKNRKKEFMKYEDGKIIPVKTEEHPDHQEWKNSSIEKEEETQTRSKEKIDIAEKVRKYRTFKTLKIIGAIAVIIFFGLTVKDLYVAFSTPPQTKVSENVKTSHSSKGTNPLSVQDSSKNPSEKGFYQTDSGELEKLLPSILDEPDKKKTSNQVKESDLKKAIDASNVVNTLLVSETKKEIGNVYLYFDNKMNQLSFDKKMQSTMENQKKLLDYLSKQKKLFEKENMIDFYSITEERLLNVTALTETIMNSYQEKFYEEIVSTMNPFIKKENELKEQQNQEFIRLLEEKDIPYTWDKEKGEIRYTIP